MTAFQTRSLLPDESLDEFAYHLRHLLADAMPALDDEVAQSAMLDHQFVAGLPESIRHKVLELNQSTAIDIALAAAKRLQALQCSTTITPQGTCLMQQSAPAVPQLAAATPQGTLLMQPFASAMLTLAATMQQVARPMQPSFLDTLQLTEALTQQTTHVGSKR